MKKVAILSFIIFCIKLDAQTTQDTIDNPYWMSMMQDRSVNFYKTKRAYNLYFSNKPKVRGTGWKQFERWAENAQYHISPDGTFYPRDYISKEYKKFLRNNLTPRSATGNWSNLGPFNNPAPASLKRGVGRVNCIAFHPTNANILYAGAPQGGFWRSTNKGVSWTSTTDNMPTLGVSDIAFIKNSSTDSIILIATGDRDALDDLTGTGVYKSTDGGVSFSASNTGMGNIRVHKLIVNTLNKNTIIAGTEDGIYVSYNQGLNWVRKTTSTADFKDIKYCPNDTSYVYATEISSSNVASFYRSTDGGNTWGTITSGFSATQKRRMVIAVTPANPNLVYVLAANSTNTGFEGFYKSTNKGTSFTSTISNSFNILGWTTDGSDVGGQGWYDLAIEASLTNENIVYTGGVNIYKTVNGGTNFSCVSAWNGFGGYPTVHADIHFLGRNPLNNELYVGNDGGIDVTTNEGTSFTTLNNQLAISQFYNLGVSQKSKSKFITGAQDNGTSMGSSSSTWSAEIGGDGFDCDVSNFDTTKMIGSLYYGRVFTTINNGGTWDEITNSISEAGNQNTSPFRTVCHLSPRVNDVMVVAINNAWLTKDVFTSNPTFINLSSGITDDGTAIRFSNANDSLVFVGWNNGVVRYCNNIFATTPTMISCATLPSGSGIYPFYERISDIETSYNNKDVLYVTKGRKVFKSINRGNTWTDITSNLPSIQMYSIVLDKNSPEGLYVGTDAGVYYKDSLTSNWILYNTGLPANSAIRDLEIVHDTVCSSNSVIFAATFGRGLWKGDLKVSETQPNPDFTIAASACTTVPVPITSSVNSVINNGAPISYQWTITPATHTYTASTSNTSQNPIVIFNNPGNYTITLKTSKPYGGFCTITKTNVISVGTKGTILLKTTNDTTICPGDTVLVRVGGLKNYLFSPNTDVSIFNDSNAYVYPTANTNYMIIGSINGGCYDTTYVDVKMKPFPAYTMTGNRNICNGDSTNISFTAVDTAYFSPTTFITNISAVNKKIIPSTSTTYNVRLVKSGLCDVKFSLPIKVLPIPNFALSKSGTQNLCIGDSLTVLENNNIPNKTWTPSTNILNLSSNSYQFKPIINTKYYLTTTDTGYCPTTKDSITFNMLSIPVISVAGATTVCTGATIKLIASGAVSYSWSPNTYLNATNKDTVICNPLLNITYTITGSNGTCSSSIQKNITVGTSTINLKYKGNTDVCTGLGTTLIASGANSYRWYPASIVSNEFEDTVKVSTSSNVILKLVGETTGCKDSMDIPINIRPIPTVSFNSTYTSPICAGTKINIKATGVNVSNFSIEPLYNVTKLKSDSFELKPMQTTKYFIVGASQYNCSGRDSISISVNPLPVVVIAPPISTLNRGDSINITASGGSQYEWTPNKYIQTSNLVSTIRSKPDSNIVYNVKVTTAAGCESSGVAILYVLQNAKPAGIHLSDIQNILVYPNPANDIINVESSEKVKGSIYNLLGSQILKFDDFSDSQKIDISQIPNGNYILILENKSGNKKVTKIEVIK